MRIKGTHRKMKKHVKVDSTKVFLKQNYENNILLQIEGLTHIIKGKLYVGL